MIKQVWWPYCKYKSECPHSVWVYMSEISAYMYQNTSSTSEIVAIYISETNTHINLHTYTIYFYGAYTKDVYTSFTVYEVTGINHCYHLFTTSIQKYKDYSASQNRTFYDYQSTVYMDDFVHKQMKITYRNSFLSHLDHIQAFLI